MIIGYKEIVETFFPILKNRLRKYVLYPFILNGDFEVPKDTGIRSVGPGLSWHLEPLPLEKKDFILDIQIKKKDSDYVYFDDNFAFEINKKIKEYRRDSCMWLSVTRTSQVLDIFGDTPITDTIYKWLEQDLKSINWIS